MVTSGRRARKEFTRRWSLRDAEIALNQVLLGGVGHVLLDVVAPGLIPRDLSAFPGRQHALRGSRTDTDEAIDRFAEGEEVGALVLLDHFAQPLEAAGEDKVDPVRHDVRIDRVAETVGVLVVGRLDVIVVLVEVLEDGAGAWGFRTQT